MAQALPLELLAPDDGEAHRVCSCGLEAPDDGVRVRCPKHGILARWGVVVRGMLVFACPKPRRSPARPPVDPRSPPPRRG